MATTSTHSSRKITFEQPQVKSSHDKSQNHSQLSENSQKGDFAVVIPTAGLGERRDWAVGVMTPEQICSLAGGHQVWFTARCPLAEDFRYKDQIPLAVLRAFSPSIEQGVCVCGHQPEQVSEIVVITDSVHAFQTLAGLILSTIYQHGGTLRSIPQQNKLPIYNVYMISRLAWTLGMRSVREQMRDRLDQAMYHASWHTSYAIPMRDVQLVLCFTPRDHWLRKWIVTSVVKAMRDGKLSNEEQVVRYMASSSELRRAIKLEQEQEKSKGAKLKDDCEERSKLPSRPAKSNYTGGNASNDPS